MEHKPREFYRLDESKEWLDKLFSSSSKSTINKRELKEFMKRHFLELNVQEICTTGYQGATEYIKCNNKRQVVWTCCGCENLFSVGYSSNFCDEHETCYNCAMGDNDFGECCFARHSLDDSRDCSTSSNSN